VSAYVEETACYNFLNDIVNLSVINIEFKILFLAILYPFVTLSGIAFTDFNETAMEVS
jgi:hypothetical protein